MTVAREKLAVLALLAAGFAWAAAPAAALPNRTEAVAFSGGPTTFPNTGSMSSSTCEADASPCSVAITTTDSAVGLNASGTGTIADGGSVINFNWVGNLTTGFPTAASPVDNITGFGTDASGILYQVNGTLEGSPTGGTVGQLVAIEWDQEVGQVIASYVTQGSFSGNFFSTSSRSCTTDSFCSVALQGTGSVPGTTSNPTTYTATGNGQVQWGGETDHITFGITSALCAPDLSVFHEESETCGVLTGTGTNGVGQRIDVVGSVVVGGFGEPTAFGFPNIRGSLAYIAEPTQ